MGMAAEPPSRFTAVATIAYYRHRLISNPWDGLMAGLLPLAAAGFLGWIVFRSLQLAPAEQRWSVIGIIAAGLLLMVVVRFTLRPPGPVAQTDPGIQVRQTCTADLDTVTGLGLDLIRYDAHFGTLVERRTPLRRYAAMLPPSSTAPVPGSG